MPRLLVMGAHNPEIVRLLESLANLGDSGYEFIGFIDNDTDKIGTLRVLGFPVLGTPELLSSADFVDCFVANNITRDTATRKQATEQLARYTDHFATLVHPAVDVRHVEVGTGAVIHEGSVISPGVRVGPHTAIMIGCMIAHDTSIGAHCFVAPGVIINGLVTVGDETEIGAGSTILPRMTIGDRVRIGAGSVIGQDIRSDLFVMGNPARAMPVRK